jgi:O-antigen biosynthesis protein
LDLSIIIVNYNVKHFLDHCLSSVQKAITSINAEVFVVDNNSTDGSATFFKNKYQTVQFIYNTSNVGFAKANNIALEKAKGTYILFLNPDTLLAEDTLEQCIAFMQSNKTCGAIGVPMYDGAGNFLKESKRSFPSPITSMFKLFGLAKLFPKNKIFGKYHLGHLANNQTNEVDVLAGAFMFVRKKVLDQVGSFDEQFFMYGEDIDLSYRIQEAGYKNYYFADTAIIHFKGESTKRGSLNYIKMFYKAMHIFVQKHYGKSKASFFNVFIQLAIVARSFLSVLKKVLLWVGLPIIDAAIILFSIWQVKLFWFKFVKPEVQYKREIVIISALLYTLVYLITAAISGLYDKPYKQKRTNSAAIICALVLLSFYALLPENYRYSRGVAFLSAIVIFFSISIFRWLLIKLSFIEEDKTINEHKQTVIVSDEVHVIEIKNIYQKAGLENHILGYVDTKANSGITNYANFKSIKNNFDFKNIVFDANCISYKNIIEDLQLFKKHDIKFFGTNTSSVISSEGQEAFGQSITANGFYNITKQSAKRAKRIVDIIASIILFLFSPLLFIITKKKRGYFQNLFQVLIGKKTWVGYNDNHTNLPNLKPNIIDINNLSESINSTFEFELNERYAKNYDYKMDIKTIYKYFFS